MSQLQKARLIPYEVVPTIQFMFNPAELTFDMNVEVVDNPGTRSENTGKSKTSFSNIKPITLTIKNIVFDTYESGDSVVSKYINNFKRALEFAPITKRPPIYSFVWGDRIYLRRCFIEKFTYNLTMFLPNGTPVRAKIDSLTLKEADELSPQTLQLVLKSVSGTVPKQLRTLDSLRSRLIRNFQQERVEQILEELEGQVNSIDRRLDRQVDKQLDRVDRMRKQLKSSSLNPQNW
ncbi:MAG: hypothetical protein J7642_08380 [Cyanobacteria bacterium SBC]|nr:hypothetical protein [Cyanobacteria bacterium SBC]